MQNDIVRYKPSKIPTGIQFGRLTVVRQTKRRYKWWRFYRCRCICKNEVEVCGRELVYGKTKSCGCLQKEAARKNAKRLPKGTAAGRRLFENRRWMARKRGLAFELTRDYFLTLTKKPCFYCGRPPFATTSTQEVNGQYSYNGIDRMNNAVGYTKENSVPCCKDCNWAKRMRSCAEFIAWIRCLSSRLPTLEQAGLSASAP
jgi:hypothetical protein